MNLTELSDLLSSATDVLRVETLDAYSSPSDADYLKRFRRGEPKPDPSEKQPWLDRLAAAAERGHPWRRLRVVSRPVPEYVRYACEWGYVDNVAAGEDVRVLDQARSGQGSRDYRAELRLAGDLLLVDGNLIDMAYSANGEFLSALGQVDQSPHNTARRNSASRIGGGWNRAIPFTDWWADNPHLHRDLSAV